MKKIILLFLLLLPVGMMGQWEELQPKSYHPAISKFISTKNYFYAFSFSDIFYSSNNGANWFNLEINDINRKILVDDNFLLLYIPGQGTYRTTDLGITWVKILNNINQIHSMALTDGKLYFTADSLGLCKSLDYGLTWEPMFNNNKIPYSILAKENKILLQHYKFGNLLTIDDGKTWNNFTVENSSNLDIIQILFYGNSFLEAKYFGCFISNDFGNHWKPIGLDSIEIFHVEIFGSTIFAGTQKGIFMTSDTGRTWIGLNKGLPYVECDAGPYNDSSTIAIGFHSGYIFNSRYCESSIYSYETSRIYRARLSDFGVSEVNEENISTDLSFSPNPANDFIEISYPVLALKDVAIQDYSDANHTLKSVVNFDIAIFNVFGEKVLSSSHYSILTTQYSAKLDVSLLTPGVYFVKIGERVGKFIKI